MLSADVAEYIAQEVSTSVFCEHIPDSPDTAVSVYTRSSTEPEPHVGLDYPVLQVLVRGPMQAGNALANDIYNLLQNFAPGAALVPGGEEVLVIEAQNVPYMLGRDNNGRYEWSLNFRFTVRNAQRKTTQ